jgi:hypothetical protein
MKTIIVKFAIHTIELYETVEIEVEENASDEEIDSEISTLFEDWLWSKLDMSYEIQE